MTSTNAMTTTAPMTTEEVHAMYRQALLAAARPREQRITEAQARRRSLFLRETELRLLIDNLDDDGVYYWTHHDEKTWRPVLSQRETSKCIFIRINEHDDKEHRIRKLDLYENENPLNRWYEGLELGRFVRPKAEQLFGEVHASLSDVASDLFIFQAGLDPLSHDILEALEANERIDMQADEKVDWQNDGF